MKVLVTGGAGFVGSHFAEDLLRQSTEVKVLDNLSSGVMSNLAQAHRYAGFEFVKGDLKHWLDWKQILEDVSVVYHFAANPEVRVGATDPKVHFDENLLATMTLLEGMRSSRTAKAIIFASTSTIYGDASLTPTPEDYGPLLPISTYGASKLGCEALIASYAHTFGIRGLILRFGNIVGVRSHHGVLPDLISKLQSDGSVLPILGDGTQEKSYMHIRDCIDAAQLITSTFMQSESRIDVYNVSSTDRITVKAIAEIIAEEIGISNVVLHFTGGVDGGRGWIGDVRLMHLSTNKLQGLGWKPKLNSRDSIRLGVRELLAASKQVK